MQGSRGQARGGAARGSKEEEARRGRVIRTVGEMRGGDSFKARGETRGGGAQRTGEESRGGAVQGSRGVAHGGVLHRMREQWAVHRTREEPVPL